MGNSVSAAESVAAHVTGSFPKGHPPMSGAAEPPPECPMHKKADSAPKAQVKFENIYSYEKIVSFLFNTFNSISFTF